MALDFLDIVSYRPVLTIFGKDRYKTIVGKIVGSLTMLSILILCTYFTIETFLRSEISIIYNLVSDSASTINLSNTPMLMALTDALMNPIPDKYFEIRVNFGNYTKDSTGENFVSQIEEYPLKSGF